MITISAAQSCTRGGVELPDVEGPSAGVVPELDVSARTARQQNWYYLVVLMIQAQLYVVRSHRRFGACGSATRSRSCA